MTKTGRPPIALPSAELVARYSGGEGSRSIAATFGVSGATIWRRLRAAGAVRGLGEHMRKACGPLWRHRDGHLRTIGRDKKKHFVHRGCWEAYNGPTPAGWVVHHKNGDTLDNRIENLECLPHGDHSRLHQAILRGRRAAAVTGIIVFTGLRPGTYTGTCDGEQTTVTVEADGTLSAECQSVSLVRMTGGLSFSCEAVDE